VLKIKDGAAVRVNPATPGPKPDLMLMLPLMTQDRRARMQRQKLTDPLVQADLVRIKTLLNRPSVKRVKPLFSRPDTFLQSERREAESKTGLEHADLGNYFSIGLDAAAQGELLVAELNAVSSVELAYLAPIPVLAQLGGPNPRPGFTPPSPPHPCLGNVAECNSMRSPSFLELQGYRNPAPDGIDAAYADFVPGGRGAGTAFVGIEYGWNTAHEDLPQPIFTSGLLSTDNFKIQHGTSAVGEIVAMNNGYGVLGIAPEARYGVSSVQFQDGAGIDQNSAEAISTATSRFRAGTVILVEIGYEVNLQQPVSKFEGYCNGETCGLCRATMADTRLMVPLEFYPAEFDAIQLATSRGFHVVAVAGNGGVVLDEPGFEGRFDRNIRDSGAIVVGASNTRRSPVCFTDRGSRVDVHAWGENVWTTGGTSVTAPGSLHAQNDPNRWYTAFNGTSSAAPMIAGTVLSIEGARQAANRPPISPARMRALLRETGTPQRDIHLGQIGPLPDLRKAIPRVLSQ
jgi:hypothetical protein